MTRTSNPGGGARCSARSGPFRIDLGPQNPVGKATRICMSRTSIWASVDFPAPRILTTPIVGSPAGSAGRCRAAATSASLSTNFAGGFR